MGIGQRAGRSLTISALAIGASRWLRSTPSAPDCLPARKLSGGSEFSARAPVAGFSFWPARAHHPTDPAVTATGSAEFCRSSRSTAHHPLFIPVTATAPPSAGPAAKGGEDRLRAPHLKAVQNAPGTTGAFYPALPCRSWQGVALAHTGQAGNGCWWTWARPTPMHLYAKRK